MDTRYDIIINLINKARLLEARSEVRTAWSEAVSAPEAKPLMLSAGRREMEDAETALSEAVQLLDTSRREISGKLPRYVLWVDGAMCGASSKVHDLIKPIVESTSRPDEVEVVDRVRGRVIDINPYLPMNWRQ
jgi:hypothetical protein